ncbi:MAG: S8 family serine peptidase [Clostridia bacterium]|nr:S8 family serine peptidase [Clostridia bacterium]
MIKMKFKMLLFTVFLLMIGICVHGADAEERYLVKFNDSAQLFSSREDSEIKDYCSATKDELLEYIDAGIVADYGIDYVVNLDSRSWNLADIKVEFPEKLNCTGKNVKVGVIDTGFLGNVSNVLTGYNYLDKNTDTTDNTSTLHGTIVSALIASPYGVAYDAQFVPLKCFDDGHDTLVSELLDAVEDAVDAYDCDVINMSFTFAGEKESLAVQLFHEKVKYAAEKGVILVASVGNDEDSTLNYPAAYDEVIGVGSVNENGEWSTFSNYNESVFVVAPGEEVPIFGGFVSGTSFAAPHVSGLAAVAKCMDSSIDGEQFAAILAETAVRNDDEEYDKYYGYGIIDCEAAAKKVIGGYKSFISPIKTGNDGICSAVYNNTAKSMMVRCICVYYDGEGKFEDCKTVDVSINSGDVYIFNTADSQNGVTYFVWSDFEKLVPMAKSRNK